MKARRHVLLRALPVIARTPRSPAEQFFPIGIFPTMLTAQLDFECLRRPELVPTLFFSCLRRCLTIAFVLAVCVLETVERLAVTCKVIASYTPSEGDRAFLHSDYDRAVTLYQAQLTLKPGDPALTASLAQVFLRQQKVKEADDIVQKALTQNPQSAILLTCARRDTVPAGHTVARGRTPQRPLKRSMPVIPLGIC